MAPERGLRGYAEGLRTECLSVRLPGIPGGEYLAGLAGWWGEQFNSFFASTVHEIRREHERVTSDIQDYLGIPHDEFTEFDRRPRKRPFVGVAEDGFLVSVPSWEDVFIYENERVFDERSRRERALDYFEQLRRSPLPPSLRESVELVTTIDDLQDEAALLSTVLRVVESVAGRAIPGVGQVAMVADGLNALNAVMAPMSGLALPGRRSKRLLAEGAAHSRKGSVGQLEDLRRTGRLGIGFGDVVQGLQATESLFGAGIQIGSIMGFMTDAFWGVVRGAEFRFPGPVWDPLGFTEAGREACYRSPSLDLVHPAAYRVLGYESLRLWSKAGRVMPWVDVLGEPVLASVLTGMRLAEGVLGPWLRSGVWVDPLVRTLELRDRVPGGVEAAEQRRLKVGEWMARTVPATVAALNRAVVAVRDRGRQLFYESLISSIGWGLLSDLEPGGRVVELEVAGPWRDPFVLAQAGRAPVFDLAD